MSKQKISWRNHLIELIVVIVGITIAFTLDGWSEERDERALEVEYLNSLKSDLLNDQNDMEIVLDSSQEISRIIVETFQLIYTNADVNNFKIYHITSTYTAPYFYPNNGTYFSLVNSGDLNILGDFELKTGLTQLYNVQLKELERVDVFIKDLVRDLIYPYMLKNITFDARGEGIVDAKPLKVNESINMLGSYMNFLGARRKVYSDIMNQFDQLISKIDEQLVRLN